MNAAHKKSRPRDPWMSVNAAAKQLRKTRHGVLAMVVRGELVSEQSAGRTVIARADVDRLVPPDDAEGDPARQAA